MKKTALNQTNKAKTLDPDVKTEVYVDDALRPSKWDEYIGQEKIKTNLRLIIDAAKKRRETCDHLLFHGQPGLGKTTLAYLVAKEMNANIRSTSGPALEKASDIAAILSNLEPHDILFIDEVHRINKLTEEILYPAMESRKLHLVVGKGPSARTFTLELPPFTIIAATTKANLLSNPLRSRFGGSFKLDYYTIKDIEKIIARSARLLQTSIMEEALPLIAQACRFTPRTANRLLKRCRDYAEVHEKGVISMDTAKNTLQLLEIDEHGLEDIDRRIIQVVIEKFKGGPVGIKSLSASLNEDPDMIEDIYEPFLLMTGLLQRTPAGRIATKDAYRHLGYEDATLL